MHFNSLTHGRIGTGAVLLSGLLLLVGSCNILGSDDDGGGGAAGPPESAMETVMAFFAVPRVMIESNEDNPVDDAYPTGMSVSGSPETGMTATASSCAPYPDVDVCVTGSVTVTGEDQGDGTFVVRFVGSVEFGNSPYSTGSIDAVVVAPMTAEGPDMESDDISLSGTISLDGSSWGFEETVNAMETYAESNNMPDLSYPYRAHYVAAGPPTTHDGAERGTICYSQDGESWGVLHVSGKVEFFGIASDPAGQMVAVGSDRWWGIPDGAGYIYYSAKGDQWELVKTTPDGEGLFRVAYGNGIWVAVGNGGALYYSSDGRNWNKGNAGTSQVLRAVAYGNNTWVIGGSSAVWKYSSDPSGGWTDIANGPTAVYGIGYDADDAPLPWRAVGAMSGTTTLYGWNNSTGLVTNLTDGELDLVPDHDRAGEPWVYTTWDDGSVTRHFILAKYNQNARIFYKTGGGSWMRKDLATSHDTPPVGVACGPPGTGEDPRCVLASGGGDIWTSDDNGASWNQKKQDWYGMGAITYRDW